MEKSPDAFRTISEVSDDLDLPQHVLRFWEQRFQQIRPLKRAGGRRYYRPADIVLLRAIRQLLYDEGYTIKGVQRLLKEQGAKGIGGGALVANALEGFAPDLAVPIEPSFDAAFEGAGGGDTAVPDPIAVRVEPSFVSRPAMPEPARHPSEASAVALAPGASPATLAAIQDALAIVESCLAILDTVRDPALDGRAADAG